MYNCIIGMRKLVFSIFLLLVFQCVLYAQEDNDVGMLLDTSYQYMNEPYDFGNSVLMTPPSYFLPFVQDNKQGFIHQGAASTIQVQTFENVMYTFIAESLTEEELIKQNARLIEHTQVLTNDDKEADFFVIAFTVKSNGEEVEYERMMLLTGDHTRAIWINANYPLIARKILYSVLKESLLTVQF